MYTTLIFVTTIITVDNDHIILYTYTLTGEYDQIDQQVHHPMYNIILSTHIVINQEDHINTN